MKTFRTFLASAVVAAATLIGFAPLSSAASSLSTASVITVTPSVLYSSETLVPAVDGVVSAPSGVEYVIPKPNCFVFMTNGVVANARDDANFFSSHIYFDVSNMPATESVYDREIWIGTSCADRATSGITPIKFGWIVMPATAVKGVDLPTKTVGATAPAADTTKPTLSSGSTTPAITAGTTAVATYTASETSTWSISGGDNAALFDVNSTSGALSFKKAAKKGNYLVELTATDAAGNKSDPIKITVTVKAALANTGAETSFTTPLALIAAGVTLSIYAQSIRRRNLSAIKR